MKQNTKILLAIGTAIFIFVALIVVIFFHFFNIANIVSGDG
jgi:hypothetical protein